MPTNFTSKITINPDLFKKFSQVVIDKSIIGRLLSVHTLAFNMQTQLFSNWCWAATATSVSHFYVATSAWTQCKVASAEKNINSCCNSPLPAGCNAYGTLDTSLKTVGQYNTFEAAASTTWAKIQTEILAGRPIGARTAWSGGGAHFVAIYGYQDYGGVKYLFIDDPIYGKSTVTLATFTSSYRGSGTWTHTFYTK